MSYQITCPALFVETTVSADVILTICHHLKNANPEIEDIILDNVIPNRDDLNLTPSEILNDIAIHFYENKSFADLIIRKNLNLLSSVAFLLLGKSSKKECAEITTLLSDWNLDENNIFQALCISFNVLLEIFLSDFPYFSYGEFSFDRDLVIMTQMELTEIFKVNDSISESNPMLYKNLKNDMDARFEKIDAKFEQIDSKMDSKFDKMMALIESLKVEKADSSRSALNMKKKMPSISPPLKTKSSPGLDKGNLFSPLDNLNDDDEDDADGDDTKSSFNSVSTREDEIEPFSDEDASMLSNSNSYTPADLYFIKDQTALWKSKPNVSRPREIHSLQSLADNRGLLIAQASGQMVQLRTLKSMKCNQAFNLFTMGSKYIDCQTNILFPRSYPEMIRYFADTTSTLQKIISEEINCDTSIRGWATSVSYFFQRYTSQLQLRFQHAYNPHYSITQYATLLRLHLWCMNIVVVNKDPAFLNNAAKIWDKFIKHDFESSPSPHDLVLACALVGYRCTTCYKLGVPVQLCSVCFSLQTVSKAGPLTTKTQLEMDYKTWSASPDGIAWVTANSKPNAWNHYLLKVATAAQRDAHNKARKSTTVPKFSSHGKCLHYLVENQHEIPLLCGSDHSAY
jgi:hypothetical protein